MNYQDFKATKCIVCQTDLEFGGVDFLTKEICCPKDRDHFFLIANPSNNEIHNIKFIIKETKFELSKRGTEIWKEKSIEKQNRIRQFAGTDWNENLIPYLFEWIKIDFPISLNDFLDSNILKDRYNKFTLLQ